MPTYQLRLIGEDNKRLLSQTIEASDDMEAFRMAYALTDGHAIEIWDGDRFIATTEAARHPQISN
jgi:hypothetical protein